jgi:alpha-glucosidase (family GH31 glycosyl hydrolase)
MKTFKTFTMLSAGTLILSSALAATMPTGGGISTSGLSTLISTPRGTVAVTPINGDIFKISRIPADSKTFSFPASQSAILPATGEGVSSYITSSTVTFLSEGVRLNVDRLTGQCVFLNAEGDTILAEAGGVDNTGEIKTVSLRNGMAQNLYGAGERGHKLRLNGDTLVMFNRQNYGYTGSDPRISQMGITAPMFVSDHGYGVLFDDYNMATLSLGKDSIVYKSETPKPLSYYFINGSGSLEGAVSNYTLLTGRQSLPPFWALGYITSRYGYHNEQEALGAIDSLKTRGYPVDGIVFDLYWYGQETDMGRFEWNTDQFPDHCRMLDSLNNMGVHTVLINQPYINKIGAIDNYKELAAGNMLTRDSLGNPHDVTTWVGEAGMLDISNPDTREWIWNRLKPLTAEGVSGWWGDLGEPEVHPLTIHHANGETASQFHNVYGNEWSKLIYEGLRADFPEMRPLLMMRGGTAGLQRYSVFPWTTDVSRSWGGFEPQIALMLNAGMSGLGYMGSDVGGFAVDPAHPYDAELYVRWLQMGTFTPMLRTHAQYKPEPYHYPAQDAIVKKFIKERYRWLPYNYTLSYENAVAGLPLARPVNFHSEAGDVDANCRDEYLWGSEVLIAPVFKAGSRTRKVMFPAGDTWVNYNNPKLTYKGGTTVSVSAPLDEMPIFVKQGGFIALYPEEIENTSKYDPSKLLVKYFRSGEPSSYVLFDDDRQNPESLSEGQYSLTEIEAQPSAKNLDITLRTEGAYPGMPETRMVTLEVVGTAMPSVVQLDGTNLQKVSSAKAIRNAAWYYDATTRTLTVGIGYNQREATISLR